MASKCKIREIQHQPGASLDKVIDDISSKLALLSGQDCEVEVNIRVKFPNSSSKTSKRGRRRSSSKHSVISLQSRREKQRPRKHYRHQRSHHQALPQSSHKLRDFVFDVESYAKVDAGDSPSYEHIPLANAVQRATSPDIITLGGLCNEAESDTSEYDSSCASSCESRSSASTSTPSTSTTVSTNQLFPKAAIRHVQHK